VSAHPNLEIVIPYGNAYAQNHLVQHLEERTLCGRERYGWSVVRKADLTTDLESPYTCKRCAKQVVK
jgi:hypothetical protein